MGNFLLGLIEGIEGVEAGGVNDGLNGFLSFSALFLEPTGRPRGRACCCGCGCWFCEALNDEDNLRVFVGMPFFFPSEFADDEENFLLRPLFSDQFLGVRLNVIEDGDDSALSLLEAAAAS